MRAAEETSRSDKDTGGCYIEPGLGIRDEEPNEWLEETIWYGMRTWHVISLGIGVALGFVILLCCCFKFRIPRTKQEIEGDYIRRKIMRKFRKRLKAIQNQELDEMDLKKALDKIRTELKSDTESLQQSDVLSGATLSSAGAINPVTGSTYRRASQIQIEISLEDLRIQSMGLGARIALAFNRFFHRSNKEPAPQEETGADNNAAEGTDKPTTALLPKQDSKSKDTDSSDKKSKTSKKTAVEAASSTSPENPTEKAKKKDKADKKGEDDKKPGTALPTAEITNEKGTKAKQSKAGKKEKTPSASQAASTNDSEKRKGASEKDESQKK